MNKIRVCFRDRVKIQRLFEIWCTKNQAEPSIHNLVGFMEQRGWLDSKKILEDLLQIEFQD